jgi:hypothetical protein
LAPAWSSSPKCSTACVGSRPEDISTLKRLALEVVAPPLLIDLRAAAAASRSNCSTDLARARLDFSAAAMPDVVGARQAEDLGLSAARSTLTAMLASVPSAAPTWEEHAVVSGAGELGHGPFDPVPAHAQPIGDTRRARERAVRWQVTPAGTVRGGTALRDAPQPGVGVGVVADDGDSDSEGGGGCGDDDDGHGNNDDGHGDADIEAGAHPRRQRRGAVPADSINTNSEATLRLYAQYFLFDGVAAARVLIEAGGKREVGVQPLLCEWFIIGGESRAVVRRGAVLRALTRGRPGDHVTHTSLRRLQHVGRCDPASPMRLAIIGEGALHVDACAVTALCIAVDSMGWLGPAAKVLQLDHVVDPDGKKPFSAATASWAMSCAAPPGSAARHAGVRAGRLRHDAGQAGGRRAGRRHAARPGQLLCRVPARPRPPPSPPTHEAAWTSRWPRLAA